MIHKKTKSMNRPWYACMCAGKGDKDMSRGLDNMKITTKENIG